MTPEQLAEVEKEFQAELTRLDWDSDGGGSTETAKVFEAFRTVVRRLLPATD